MYTARVSKSSGEMLVKEYCTTRNRVVKDKAVRAFLPLVHHILGRINISAHSRLTKEDLYQFGIVGLLSALERYDITAGASFKTFAYRRIHGEIIDSMRRDGVLSRDQMKKMNMITKARQTLTYSLGREATFDEISQETGISMEDIGKVMQTAQLNLSISLDDGYEDDEGEHLSLLDTMPDRGILTPEQEMEQTSLKAELKSAIKSLPERERLILALYYYEELTLSDIGQVIGLSESRISQILNQTHMELKQKLGTGTKLPF